ncbi:asparaginase [uncultured Selenomonas sp.]|uniref:asparaginase n=1 Tax=uncultured Selenomonas sp. TaxID=159275 RepID=UPI0025CCC41E|nr:asparaginase [uncultured Selenomonas sp.]
METTSKKKHICVLATGGTIASRPTPNGLMPALSGEDILAMVPDLRARCDIDCVQLLQLDSTNLQPEHWIRMARAVAERRTQYDAFVITHGTDTMAYSAAALHYMLENIDRPVVLTGSQLPAGVPGTDAEQNLLTAFHAALGGRAGVYIAFGGRVMFGNDARKLCTMQLTAFGNINRPLAGRFAGGRLKWLAEASAPAGTFRLHDQLDTRVGVLKIVPGLPPRMLEAFVDAGFRAVILEGYGLGGIPDQESPMNFLPAFQYAKDHGCRLVCTTQCTYDGVDMDSYEMGVRAQQLGVEPGGTLTTEALLCKLMIELAEG